MTRLSLSISSGTISICPNVGYWHKADIPKTAANVRLSLSEDRLPFRWIWSPAGRACYFFIIVVVRYETTAAAPWALLLIVRTFLNDAIAFAVWTGFHRASL
jgi:hypothetical protein